MKCQAKINNAERALEMECEADGAMRLVLAGKSFRMDAIETVPGSFSLLIGGSGFEARVQLEGDNLLVHCRGAEFRVALHDPRAWRRGHGGALEAEGRQQVTAPMPGKVVRVLVAAGDAVELGQGLLVVEAMKMQNEIRAPKSGVVEKLSVKEGQAVRAGENLAVIA